jgi:hypothetical protein
MGIFAMPRRISISATGSWVVSRRYNGHDKIHRFSQLGACLPGNAVREQSLVPRPEFRSLAALTHF